MTIDATAVAAAAVAAVVVVAAADLLFARWTKSNLENWDIMVTFFPFAKVIYQYVMSFSWLK